MKTFVTNVRLALLALTLVVGLASCKKDKDPEPEINPSNLIDKRWKLTAMEVDPALDYDKDGTPDKDWIDFLIPECVQDDIYIFNADGTISGEEGTPCDEEEEEAPEGQPTWSYNSKTKTFTMKDDSSTETFKVTEMSASTLKLAMTDDTGDKTITVTAVWKAQ